MKYFGNPILIVACLFCSLLSNGSFFLSSYWMSIWVEAYEHKAHIDIAYYLGIYALFTFLGTVTVGATIVTFEWGGWRAAQNLHNAFICAVMSAPLSWFRAVPLGRAMNRFTRDMSSIDRSLSSMLRSTLGSIFALLFRVVAVSSLLPILILPVLCASAISIVVGEMYARTAVILRRLASAAHSPIFSHFVSTLAGMHVIRARDGMHEAFSEDLATKLRVWTAAAEANYNSNRWVALRVSLVTALISVLVGIISLSKIGAVSAGLIGFSLQNAVGLSQSVITLVRAVNDLDIEMQSVKSSCQSMKSCCTNKFQFHRVKEYFEVPSEDKDDEPFADEEDFDEKHCLVNSRDVIPEEWPRSGAIEFRNVTVRYEDGPNILTDINLKFKAGERVAIIGRTGSGKTTVSLEQTFRWSMADLPRNSSSCHYSDSLILFLVKFSTTELTSQRLRGVDYAGVSLSSRRNPRCSAGPYDQILIQQASFLKTIFRGFLPAVKTLLPYQTINHPTKSWWTTATTLVMAFSYQRRWMLVERISRMASVRYYHSAVH
jgi:ABC-type multidrug transport system fused ATPase/permease subunit